MRNLCDQLQKWYGEQVDGEWEHEYGIEIKTLDNPGWIVWIDIKGTSLSNKIFINENHDHGDNDWYRVWVENGQFKGVGDPTKLSLILDKFLYWATGK